MKISKTTRDFVIVCALASFIAMPSRADDVSQPPSPPVAPAYEPAPGASARPMTPQTAPTAPAEKFGQPVSDQSNQQGPTGLPKAVQTGGISYITGGIGDEERDAL